jgi:ABC-type Fe3+/spermidine/putrescine transport system ATPase subunit
MMDISHPLLSLASVSHQYGRVQALADLTLELSEGEFLSIVGPSGCGKSTLLKIMSGVIPATRGDVRFRGTPLSVLSAAEHGILMVWQSLALFPHLDVAGNVGFGLSVRNVGSALRRQRVRSALELVQLSGFENRRVDTLSGGEQQRVALARALVLEPTILLLDGPLQGLDRHLRSHLIGMIRQLHRQLEITMVMVTHEQSEAMLLSTRLAVMRRGRIEQIATPDTVLRRPIKRFVAEFVGDHNVFSGRLLELKDNLATVQLPMGSFQGNLPNWIVYRPTVGDQVAYVTDAHKVIVGDNGQHTMRATVEAIVETGVAESIDLTSEGGNVIKCQRAKTAANIPLTLRTNVVLSWNSGDAYILPNE